MDVVIVAFLLLLLWLLLLLFAAVAVVVVAFVVVVFEKTLSRFHQNIGPRHFLSLATNLRKPQKEITEVQKDKKILVRIFW